MRDRLIELILECSTYTPEYSEQARLHAEYLAQHLLNEGVIIPPCKVGDTVYFNKAELQETCPAKVVGIYINYYTPSMPLWIKVEYESELIGNYRERMSGEVFELLCHYSREEAEKALAERIKNNG